MSDFSIADILARGYQQRAPLITQPTGLAAAMPGVVNLANQGVQAYGQAKQAQSVQQARQAYANYLSTPPNQRDPATTQAGIQAGLSLGIQPTNPLDAQFKQSEIDRNTAFANVLKNKPLTPANRFGVGQTFPQPVIDAWVKKITTKNPKTGQPYAVLSDIPGGMAANSLRAQVAASLGSVPGYDVGAGAAGRAGAISSAKFQEAGSPQTTARTANTANAQLDILDEISKKFPRSNVQMMNTPIIKIDSQTMPEAQNWIIALNSFRNEYASALMRGHMPREGALAESAKALPENITPKQLESAIPLLRRELAALSKGQMTRATDSSTPVSTQSDNSALLDKYGTP